MIKTLLKQIGEYKKDTIITPIFTILEVVAELLVPFVIASLIDKGIEAGNLRNVYLYGALMIVLAFFGLEPVCTTIEHDLPGAFSGRLRSFSLPYGKDACQKWPCLPEKPLGHPASSDCTYRF